MKKRWLALMLMLCLVMGGCSDKRQEKVSGTGYYFDTVVTLTLYGAPEGLMEQLWQECARYEQLLSKTIRGSDVDRINHAQGQPVTVDAETWQILKRAREISIKTGGAFSVTIAPLSAQWDFTGGTKRVPDAESIHAALPLVNDSLIVLGENNTVTLPEGMSIDLGGIAKGYIADRLAAMIRGRVTGATLNFGGNVFAVGSKADGSPFRIGIANPEDPGSAAAVVTVKDRSVVTSGTYQRCFTLDGQTYHHILDPETGMPAETGLASASVIAQSSMDADALATACIVLGMEQAVALVEEMGLEALLITDEGDMIATPGLMEKYPVQTAG